MQIGVIGISYKSAPLELREDVARVAEGAFTFWSSVVLSTCNRTEIYFDSDNLAETHSQILQFLKKNLKTPFEHVMYAFFGGECFTHLAMVTAGIESALIGESDIQRQVKMAYLKTCREAKLSSRLHFLFQKSLKIGKEIRSSFYSPMNLEGIVLQLVRNFFKTKPLTTVFFIGYSEINRKIASLLVKCCNIRATFCTAHLHQAQSFAIDHAITLVDRDNLSSWTEFDLVIAATNRKEEGHLISASPSAPCKTKLMLDLSVPRSIHPDLNRNPCLTLLNMEEIGNLVKKERGKRLEEVYRVREKIEGHVKKQMTIFYQKNHFHRVLPCLS